MAFTFEQLFAADPSNPANIAQNASIVIFAPGDATMAPLTITDPDGSPLPNPFPVNANGFGPAFAHETLDRVAWSGGGFTGFVTSYEGMKQVALDAKTAAESAGATAGAAAQADLEARIASGVFKGDKGVDGSNVLPTDTAIKQALENPASATAKTLKVADNKARLSAQGAITISWDDGYERIHRVLFPILRDEYPTQRHTFGITSSFVGTNTTTYVTAAQVQEIHAAGHEIANHSHNHTNMSTITPAARLTEFDTSNAALEAMIGDKVTTFIYPLGNNGRIAQTDQELYGRFSRIVNAGVSWGGSMVPMNQRNGLFMVPRPAVWDSSTHQHVLELIRQTATQPVILNLYSHRPGDGPTGGTSGGGAADMTVAEIREALTLIEELGIPVVNIRDAYPGQPVLGSPGAEDGTRGWSVVQSGAGKSFTSVTDTPAAGLNGTKSFKLASTDATGFIYAYQDMPCIEGQSYTFSGRARKMATTTAGTATIRIQARDQFGAAIGGITSAANGFADGVWGKISTAAVVAPVGAQTFRVDFILNTHVGEMYVDHLYYGRTGFGDFG